MICCPAGYCGCPAAAVKADRIFHEVASGRTIKDRPQLERAIEALGAGVVLVIAEWDWATRSMMEGINIIQHHSARRGKISYLKGLGQTLA
ncbi:recombinase family protein [Sulfitobacter sp.]|uniref:recombinase family protein n=1 Tax=Sulfitobacter sp. TaxID=1903071 RepID=UPI003EF7715F